jgi:hypothetical protein
MKTPFLLALALSLSASTAIAGTFSGNGALSLAALVGQESPNLSRGEKNLLLQYLNGEAKAKFPKGKDLVVKADSVTCRISNVDITTHFCDLKFGSRTIAFSGRKAHELYATLIENGVPSDGAAGSIFEAIGALDCRIVPAEVAEVSGGGAKCDYTAAK